MKKYKSIQKHTHHLSTRYTFYMPYIELEKTITIAINIKINQKSPKTLLTFLISLHFMIFFFFCLSHFEGALFFSSHCGQLHDDMVTTHVQHIHDHENMMPLLFCFLTILKTHKDSYKFLVWCNNVCFHKISRNHNNSPQLLAW